MASTADLRRAQAAENYTEVSRIAGLLAQARGSQAGVADRVTTSTYTASSPLTPAQRTNAFEAYRRNFERRAPAWAASLQRPESLNTPLRYGSSIISGCCYAAKAGAANVASLLGIAVAFAEPMLRVQELCGTGVFPFPANTSGTGDAFNAANDALARARAQGQLHIAVRHNWLIDDLGDGGLQFDNGNAGVAMIHLYRATGNERYLHSAQASALWAASRPSVHNWNYNSFSAYLLAEMALATNHQSWTTEAIKKARLGIYPGQLISGPRRGRWYDAHNASLVYHHIIMRALSALAAAATGEDRAAAIERWQLAALGASSEFTSSSVGNVNGALEAYSHAAMYGLVYSSTLDSINRFANSRLRSGGMPAEPVAIGSWLAFQNVGIGSLPDWPPTPIPEPAPEPEPEPLPPLPDPDAPPQVETCPTCGRSVCPTCGR